MKDKLHNYMLDQNINYDNLLIVLINQAENKSNDNSYKNIIKLYYKVVDNNRYNELMKNFKKKYIFDEDSIDYDHDIKEHWGMRKMYDYITDHIHPEVLSIFTLNILHHRLFSEVPFPEASNGFRQDFAYISGAPFQLEHHYKITEKMNEMMPKVNEIVKLGAKLGKQSDVDKIIEYIDMVVDLGNTLIKVHPFFDGNGRTIRCFMNILFKLAHIPPVYVGKQDKEEYLKAGNLATVDNYNDAIHTFYYRKICESLYEFDLKKHINFEEENRITL